MENKERIERHLLVIDDEVEITKSIFRQFRRKYNVHTAISGFEAMDIMDKEPIQVVVSDQRMPGMTGVDFFSKIKDKYPDTLKMILTGYSDIEAVVDAINEGQVFRYLTKPWNPVELDIAVNEAFEKFDLVTNNKRLMNELHEANLSLEEKVKKRTKQLEETNVELSELNKEKNKYIGIVAHDLRNPIGAAQSFASLLLEDFGSFTEGVKVKYLGIISNRCDYALRLITNFLDTSKIEAGIFNVKKEEKEYLDFLRKNIEQNSMLAAKKSQKIFINCSLESVCFKFDMDKMEQVLNNLLSNAIKYSLEGETITVEINKENDSVITKVIDRGQGIPKEELATIFDAYQTTSVKPTANEKSIGLGLAIVKKIVEAHSGSIRAESEPGQGSIFIFSLPVL